MSPDVFFYEKVFSCFVLSLLRKANKYDKKNAKKSVDLATFKGPPIFFDEPRGGWVGQMPKKDQGQICFRFWLCGVISPPSRETPQKRDKKIDENFGFGFSCFVKSLWTRFFCKMFSVVFFELPSPRNTPKREKEKKSR
jgi:hypothetical protein